MKYKEVQEAFNILGLLIKYVLFSSLRCVRLLLGLEVFFRHSSVSEA